MWQLVLGLVMTGPAWLYLAILPGLAVAARRDDRQALRWVLLGSAAVAAAVLGFVDRILLTDQLRSWDRSAITVATAMAAPWPAVLLLGGLAWLPAPVRLRPLGTAALALGVALSCVLVQVEMAVLVWIDVVSMPGEAFSLDSGLLALAHQVLGVAMLSVVLAIGVRRSRMRAERGPRDAGAIAAMLRATALTGLPLCLASAVELQLFNLGMDDFGFSRAPLDVIAAWVAWASPAWLGVAWWAAREPGSSPAPICPRLRLAVLGLSHASIQVLIATAATAAYRLIPVD